MSEYIAGTQDAFVQMMNDKAKQLGMNDTTFKNCHGLDTDGHVTSSYDIALMSKELLNNYPQISNYTTIWTDSLRNGKSQLSNTNKLIKTYKGITGLKTGSTGLALYNLSASATRDGLSLIAVIMKAPSTKIRFAEASKLLDYGFNTFSHKQFAKKGDFIKEISIDKSIQKSVNAIYESDSGILLAKGEDKNIVQSVTFDENISAPISKGQKIGNISYSLNGNTLSTVNIIADANVDKINFFTMGYHIVKNWISLLR